MSQGNGGRRRIGIKDVALQAGVSITTVSHALSGKGRLTDETRERVRRIASDLGYTPHPVARSLASGRTGIYDIEVRNQHGERIALFRGKSHRIKGHVIDALGAN